MLEFFAVNFSKFWFVFVLLLIAGGAAATSQRRSRSRLVGQLIALGSAVFILIGVTGLLLGVVQNP